MIIVKGNSISVTELNGEAASILFVAGGYYVFVESGIVENELRVAYNFMVADQSSPKPIRILDLQGTEIPQELGDCLIERAKLAANGGFVVDEFLPSDQNNDKTAGSSSNSEN